MNLVPILLPLLLLVLCSWIRSTTGERQLVTRLQRIDIPYTVGGSKKDYRFPINQTNDQRELVWCTISAEEQKKCMDWAEALRREVRGRGVPQDSHLNLFTLSCTQAYDKDQCMNLMANERVHLVTLDPGEIFMGGRHHSLVPVIAERYGPKRDSGYYSVAVVRRDDSSIKSPLDLKGKKACFTGVGHMGGWVLPLVSLLDSNILFVKDCNNIVKTTASFFNASCAPNALIDKHNPAGDNPISMCSLCNGKCSGNDPFSGWDGAFACLASKGDVAFLRHTTVDVMTASSRGRILGKNKHDFELLCPGERGGRAPVQSYLNCNWGFVPAHAVVALSSVSPQKRLDMQYFLLENAKVFGGHFTTQSVPSGQGFSNRTSGSQQQQFQNQRLNSGLGQRFSNANEGRSNFSLFGDHSSIVKNLIFSSETSALIRILPEKQTFSGYLGRDYLGYFEKLRKCYVPTAQLCVVGEKELDKCNRMKTAFRAQMMKPELSCYPAHDTLSCMEYIREGRADLTMLDAGDIYKAGRGFNLMPILSEQYNLMESNYYVVAVARQSDKETDLLYLKGKRSCHTGYGLAAGWIVPLSFLLSNGRMRSGARGCHDGSASAASQFFQKACAPGSLSSRFVGASSSWDSGNLCDLCHGSSFAFCSRDASEPFYGHTGALRCLVEGGGEIAFTKHTTILENAGGRNPSLWSRNVIPDDFELLCRDGTRATYNNYEKCNLGKVASNAMVTAANRPQGHKEAYINLFLLAQQFYGSKYSEDFTFKMFTSPSPQWPDLIFQEATSQLQAVPENKRNYESYLGHDFLKSMKIVDCSSSPRIEGHIVLLFLLPLFSLLLLTQSIWLGVGSN